MGGGGGKRGGKGRRMREREIERTRNIDEEKTN